jgi:hypothetical protein
MAFGEIVSNTLQVIVVGILLGAGLPALFACGIKLLDIGTAHPAATPTGTAGGNKAALVGGYAIFAAIVVVVLYAILFVVKSSLSHYLGIELPI